MTSSRALRSSLRHPQRAHRLVVAGLVAASALVPVALASTPAEAAGTTPS